MLSHDQPLMHATDFPRPRASVPVTVDSKKHHCRHDEKMQGTSAEGIRFQKLSPVRYLRPGTSTFGYLDPLQRSLEGSHCLEQELSGGPTTKNATSPDIQPAALEPAEAPRHGQVAQDCAGT